MKKLQKKQASLSRRHTRVRGKISGSADRPRLCITRSKDHFKIRYGFIPHADIVCDRIFKKHYILIHHCNGSGKNVSRDLKDRFAVKQKILLWYIFLVHTDSKRTAAG